MTDTFLLTRETLDQALRKLTALLPSENAVPTGGRFDGRNETFNSPQQLQAGLADWMNEHRDCTGWILTTERLYLVPAEKPAPEEIPLGAELHDAVEDQSLHVRYIANTWSWQEMKKVPETGPADSFIEKRTVMIDSKRNPNIQGPYARYEVEWRLIPAPGDADAPATFRPARCRFTGWSPTP